MQSHLSASVRSEPGRLPYPGRITYDPTTRDLKQAATGAPGASWTSWRVRPESARRAAAFPA
jgi:hypothetical protein